MEQQTLRNFRMVVALGFIALVTTTVSQASDLERHLRDQYRGKILVLRGFYSGERLRYESAGALEGGRAGDWTTDGVVRVDDIHVSGRALKIKARRLMVVSSGGNGLQFDAEVASGQKTLKKAAVVLELEAHMDGDGLTEEKANAILSRIFLTSKDNFADAVPDFWTSCIADGLSGKNENCRFSAEMATVPGMSSPVAVTHSSVSPSGQNCPPECESSATNSGAPFRIGHGVKPPRVIYQQEPEFSDPARKAKYQGTMTMGLIVDKEGHPQNIRILSPLGAGLDAKAVRAVETWKFQPAVKDGEPVAVQIAVEVDFHLR